MFAITLAFTNIRGTTARILEKIPTHSKSHAEKYTVNHDGVENNIFKIWHQTMEFQWYIGLKMTTPQVEGKYLGQAKL